MKGYFLIMSNNINCIHRNHENGYCIDCGEEINLELQFVKDTTEFNTTYNIKSSHSNKNIQFNYIEKFFIKDEKKTQLETIKTILQNFELTKYTNQINYMINTIKFYGKISLSDKIFLCLYNISIEYAIPLTVLDFTKFIKIKKCRFLNIYKKTFKYKIKHESYFKNIYDRSVQEATTKFNVINVLEFQTYLKVCKALPTTNYQTLCLVLIMATTCSTPNNDGIKFFNKNRHIYYKYKKHLN